jgi:hypothetical protein
MTFALLLSITNGALTYLNALLLKFILINPKNETTKSSYVKESVNLPCPLIKIILADIATAIAY